MLERHKPSYYVSQTQAKGMDGGNESQVKSSLLDSYTILRVSWIDTLLFFFNQSHTG